jgi:hypothetical protein
MKGITLLAALLAYFLLTSCQKEPTLQKYFVENSDKKDFIALDISPSIINVDQTKLTSEQKTALTSFDKMNIIAFKSNKNNQVEYSEESQKVTQILKGKEYNELMKIGSGKDAASVSFVGDENHINEFVLFAKKKDNGFAVVRILGNDMNPNNIMNMLSVLKSSNIDMTQLSSLQGLIK